MKFKVGDLLAHKAQPEVAIRRVEVDSLSNQEYILSHLHDGGSTGGWLTRDYVEGTYVLYKQRPEDQPPPTKNDEVPIQDRVVVDILHRKEVGVKRYGTTLQPFNGRDAMQDLYEELLDAVMYLKQAMLERGSDG